MRTRHFLVSIWVLLVTALPLGADGNGIQQGEAFPSIRLPTLGGDGFESLASFRGRKLLVHIFASW